MQTPIFVANWKMKHLAADAEKFAEEFCKLFRERADGFCDAWIAPPLTSTAALRAALGKRNVRVGVQNVHWLSGGAHTGEVSVAMVKETGASFVIVGHSERRLFYGESSEAVSQRARAALNGGLSTIVCVGESREQFEAQRTAEVVTAQLQSSLNGIEAPLTPELLVAYEPVWAIGTGLAATPDIAESVHALIRELLVSQFGSDAGNGIPILYGGSTTPENIAGLTSRKNVQGALIGGASLKPDSFAALIANGRDRS